MPNQRHREKSQLNVYLPEEVVNLVDAYATTRGLSRAQAAALLLGRELGADQDEIARIMKLNAGEEKE